MMQAKTHDRPINVFVCNFITLRNRLEKVNRTFESIVQPKFAVPLLLLKENSSSIAEISEINKNVKIGRLPLFPWK